MAKTKTASRMFLQSKIADNYKQLQFKLEFYFVNYILLKSLKISTL